MSTETVKECGHERTRYLFTEMLYQRRVFQCLDCGVRLADKEGYRE